MTQANNTVEAARVLLEAMDAREKAEFRLSLHNGNVASLAPALFTDHEKTKPVARRTGALKERVAQAKVVEQAAREHLEAVLGYKREGAERDARAGAQ